MTTEREARDVAGGELLLVVANFFESLDHAVFARMVNYLENLIFFCINSIKLTLKAKQEWGRFWVIHCRFSIQNLYLSFSCFMSHTVFTIIIHCWLWWDNCSLSSSCVLCWSPHGCVTLLVQISSRPSPYYDSVGSHLLLYPFNVSIEIVGFSQVLFLKSLHFAFPHLKNVTFNIYDVTRLNITPESLIICTLETSETSTKHALNYRRNSHTSLFPLRGAFV